MREDLIAELRELCAIEGRPLTVGERARTNIAMSEAAAALEAAREDEEAKTRTPTHEEWERAHQQFHQPPPDKDRDRLDWLEGVARTTGIFLYNGVDTKRERQTAVGLAFLSGRLDRTLRQAIDQARGKGVQDEA